MIGGGSLVAVVRQQHHLAGVSIDQPQTILEVVGNGPSAVGGSVDMPDRDARIVYGHLADDSHLAGAEVDDADAGWMILKAGRAPPRFLTDLRTAWFFSARDFYFENQPFAQLPFADFLNRCRETRRFVNLSLIRFLMISLSAR